MLLPLMIMPPPREELLAAVQPPTPPTLAPLTCTFNLPDSPAHSNRRTPLCFQVPYTPRSAKLPLPRILALTPAILRTPLYTDLMGGRTPMVSYTRTENLSEMLTTSLHPYAV
jgi:hypothetical protein